MRHNNSMVKTKALTRMMAALMPPGITLKGENLR